MSIIPPNLQANLASNFKKPVTEEFWHYLAKNKLKESIYQDATIRQRMKQIQDKLGECSFDRQAAYGWTPLHVAVLSNNPAGVRFFLSRGARVDIQDNEGKTPLEYACHSPELMHKHLPLLDEHFSLLIDNYDSLIRKETDPSRFKLPSTVPAAHPSIVKQILSSLLPPVISLPSSPFIYQENTNDFGIEIQDLLFAKGLSSSSSSINPIMFRVDHVVRNLSKIAKCEGFKLTFTKISYYPRDSFIRTMTGVTTFAQPSQHLQLAIERAVSKAAYFGESAPVCARVRFLAGHMGSSAKVKHLTDTTQFSSFRSPKLPAYIEGGNLFTLTNANGKRKILIGKDHLAQIHAQLRLEKYFDSHPPLPLDFSLSQDDIRKLAEEMYAMGLLSLGKEKKSGYISPSMMENVYSEFYRKKDVERSTFRQIAIEKGLTPFFLENKDLEEARPLVERYAAQRKALENALAEELGVASQDLHFVPQVSYHLDIFMQPGPKGSIFLQDFSLCTNLLKQLQNVDTFLSLKLYPDDRFMLARYLATAKRLEKELGPLLTEARSELEKAGFIVIPTPGIFLDQHYQLEDRTFHMNFLNAVTGWSEKQKRYFYITTGANAGTRLGAQLMQLFSMFLKQYELNLEVYFTGENPELEGDFSQAMELWNQIGSKNLELGALAGIHCLSIEKEMKSHQYSPL